MPKKTRLSSRQHSGRLRPHEHTSYGLLALLVLLVGFFLAGLTVSSVAFASPPPQSDSVSLTGTMPGPPPATAATITSPQNQQQFQSTPITVTGNCPPGTVVEVFKNNIFAGSTICSSSGSYSVKIDLLYGNNTLTVNDYNANNQAGPSSKAVDVVYNAQPPVSALISNINFTSTQLLLETNAVYRGAFPGQEITVPINILGGVAPFAIDVNWGDNTTQVLPASANTIINATHTYKRPGTYDISILGSDSQQRVGFLQVAAIINGQPAALTGSTSSPSHTNELIVLWPLYACAATLVVSFWLGENREKHVLEHALRPTPTLGANPHVSH